MSIDSKLTKETDVYAFAITVVEVLTKGEAIPWGSELLDASVREHMLSTPYLNLYSRSLLLIGSSDGRRPTLVRPAGTHSQPDLERLQVLFRLVEECWHQDPTKRPSFGEIVSRLKRLHNTRDRLSKWSKVLRTLTCGTLG